MGGGGGGAGFFGCPSWDSHASSPWQAEQCFTFSWTQHREAWSTKWGSGLHPHPLPAAMGWGGTAHCTADRWRKEGREGARQGGGRAWSRGDGTWIRTPTANQLLTTNCQSPTPNQLPTANCQPTANHQLPCTNCQPPTTLPTNCQLPTSNRQLAAAGKADAPNDNFDNSGCRQAAPCPRQKAPRCRGVWHAPSAPRGAARACGPQRGKPPSSQGSAGVGEWAAGWRPQALWISCLRPVRNTPSCWTSWTCNQRAQRYLSRGARKTPGVCGGEAVCGGLQPTLIGLEEGHREALQRHFRTRPLPESGPPLLPHRSPPPPLSRPH